MARSIYFGCDYHDAENSVLANRDLLRVTPNGDWLCHDCYHEIGSFSGMPEWEAMQPPPKYVPESRSTP